MCFMCVSAQVFWLSCVFQVHYQGAESEVVQLGLELAPIRDGSVSGGSFTCYATTLAMAIACKYILDYVFLTDIYYYRY